MLQMMRAVALAANSSVIKIVQARFLCVEAYVKVIAFLDPCQTVPFIPAEGIVYGRKRPGQI